MTISIDEVRAQLQISTEVIAALAVYTQRLFLAKDIPQSAWPVISNIHGKMLDELCQATKAECPTYRGAMPTNPATLIANGSI